MIRVLGVARRGAMKARGQPLTSCTGCSPAPLRSCDSPARAQTKALVGVCAAMRPGPLTSPMAATKASLRTLARRWPQLQSELTQLDTQLQTLVTSVAPTLVALPGSGSTPPGSCWSPPATTPNGSAQRPPSRICAAPPDPGLLGQDPPAPPQPRRRPPGQRRAAPHRGRTAALASAHPRLRRQAHRPGQDQQRDPPLSHWTSIRWRLAQEPGRDCSVSVQGRPRCLAARRPV
jgi:hypothetical protein